MYCESKWNPWNLHDRSRPHVHSDDRKARSKRTVKRNPYVLFAHFAGFRPPILALAVYDTVAFHCQPRNARKSKPLTKLIVTPSGSFLGCKYCSCNLQAYNVNNQFNMEFSWYSASIILKTIQPNIWVSYFDWNMRLARTKKRQWAHYKFLLRWYL